MSNLDGKSFQNLPSEILIQIVQHLSPYDTVSIGQVSRLFRQIADEPTLWRQHCTNRYRYWAKRHNFAQKLQAPAKEVDWKRLYRDRVAADRVANTEFDGILASTTRRLPRIERIADLEHDAKDALFKHARNKIDTELPLARHFWSRQILLRIAREEAIDIWARLARGEEFDHALALSAYDAFVAGDQSWGDPNYVNHELQHLADEVRATYKNWDQLHTRAKAMKLAEFLQDKGFLGVRVHQDGYALANNFIGLALKHPQHEALPLICAVIYSSLAKRVGVKAEPINYPFHVYVTIQAPLGVDLDGKPSQIVELTQKEYDDTAKIPNVLYKVQDGQNVIYRCTPDTMYIDAFRPGTAEVSVDILRQYLNRMGVSPAYHPGFLRPCSTRDLVIRTRNNIIQALGNDGTNNIPSEYPLGPEWFTEMAYYSTIWVHLLGSSDTENVSLAQRRRALQPLAEHVTNNYQLDTELVENYVLPIFRNLPDYPPLLDITQTTRFEDIGPPPIHARTDEVTRKVKYKVGQVFTHRRYGYIGLIIGWDTKCELGEQWISQMGVDSLPGGRNQSFYNVV